MTREQAIKLIRGGFDGIREWNAYLKPADSIYSLDKADFHECGIFGADLSYCSMRDARLDCSHFERLYVRGADWNGVNTQGSLLCNSQLINVSLDSSRLSRTTISGVSFIGCTFNGADFTDAVMETCFFCNSDLSGAIGLDSMSHYCPSSLDAETLRLCGWKLPDEFLRSCGYQEWEVLSVRLYDPSLTAAQLADLQYAVFDKRTNGPLFIGGVFISYSHCDKAVANKLRAALYESGASVWMDVHDAVAGPLDRQIDKAIRLNDVVLLILSKDSVNSDWVELELERAHRKEKEENRIVLCPIAVDDAWKSKMDNVLWRHLKEKNILDFAKWKTRAFDAQYKKLFAGLKIYYPPKSASGMAVTDHPGSKPR